MFTVSVSCQCVKWDGVFTVMYHASELSGRESVFCECIMPVC